MATGFSIKVEGLRELQKALRQLDKLDTELFEAHKRASYLAANAAIAEAPVISGRLAQSIRARPMKTEGRITLGTNKGVPYAGPVHFGWPAKNKKPNKFAYRAIAKEQPRILRAYEADVEKLLRRLKLRP